MSTRYRRGVKFDHELGTKNDFYLKYVIAGAIIRDGDRKRGVHASPCVVPKKLFLEKIAPPFTS